MYRAGVGALYTMALAHTFYDDWRDVHNSPSHPSSRGSIKRVFVPTLDQRLHIQFGQTTHYYMYCFPAQHQTTWRRINHRTHSREPAQVMKFDAYAVNWTYILCVLPQSICAVDMLCSEMQFSILCIGVVYALESATGDSGAGKSRRLATDQREWHFWLKRKRCELWMCLSLRRFWIRLSDRSGSSFHMTKMSGFRKYRLGSLFCSNRFYFAVNSADACLVHTQRHHLAYNFSKVLLYTYRFRASSAIRGTLVSPSALWSGSFARRT